MSEEIIKVLDELGKRFGIAIDWTNSNMMPYLQDLLKRFILYRNTLAIIQIILSVILIISNIIFLVKLKKWYKEDEYCDEELLIWGAIGSLGIIALGIGLIIGNASGITQNIYMPELTILKYIQNSF